MPRFLFHTSAARSISDIAAFADCSILYVTIGHAASRFPSVGTAGQLPYFRESFQLSAAMLAFHHDVGRHARRSPIEFRLQRQLREVLSTSNRHSFSPATTPYSCISAFLDASPRSISPITPAYRAMPHADYLFLLFSFSAFSERR